MGYVVPFKRYRPGSRDDGIPFIGVRIKESETEDGVYVLIDTVLFDEVDSDPEDPQLRSFTSTEGTISVSEDPWYIVTFFDADGNEQDTDPVQPGAITQGLYYADPDDVRVWLGLTSAQLSDAVLERPIILAQYDIDAACGGWSVYEDTGLKFASDDTDDVLEDWQLILLTRATCAQVEYRLSMGDEFMVKEQYETQSGPGYSTSGQLRKVAGQAYTFLRQAGLLRLQGRMSNRDPLRFGELPRAN